MDVPVEIFALFIGMSLSLMVVGLVKKVPACLVFAGMFILAISVATDNIVFGQNNDTITTTTIENATISNSTQVFHYNVDSSLVTVTVRFDGVSPARWAEGANTANSALIGDNIQCISIPVARVGNGVSAWNIEIGVMDSSAQMVKSFGNVSHSSLNTSFVWQTACVPEGQERTILSTDKVGLRFLFGNSSHFINVRSDSNNPFNGTDTIRFERPTTVWSPTSAHDITMKLWDIVDVPINVGDVDESVLTYDNNDIAFTELIKVLFALFAVILMLIGVLILKSIEVIR